MVERGIQSNQIISQMIEKSFFRYGYTIWRSLIDTMRVSMHVGGHIRSVASNKWYLSPSNKSDQSWWCSSASLSCVRNNYLFTCLPTWQLSPSHQTRAHQNAIIFSFPRRRFECVAKNICSIRISIDVYESLTDHTYYYYYMYIFHMESTKYAPIINRIIVLGPLHFM